MLEWLASTAVTPFLHLRMDDQMALREGESEVGCCCQDQHHLGRKTPRPPWNSRLVCLHEQPDVWEFLEKVGKALLCGSTNEYKWKTKKLAVNEFTIFYT